MERSSNKPLIAVLAAAVIVVVIIVGVTYAKKGHSFLSACATKPSLNAKAPTTTQCVCLYFLAVTRHSSDEVAFIGALMGNDQSALRALKRKHGDDWIPMTFVNVQWTMHQCIPQ